MKPYSLVISVILKSGKEKTYTSYSPEALTKENIEQVSEQLKNIIESVCKEDSLGAITLKISPNKEVLINTKEIALIEFEVVEN